MISIATAPPACHSCGHVERTSVRLAGIEHTHDRCLHPTGPHPMHEPCAWHSNGAAMRAEYHQVRK